MRVVDLSTALQNLWVAIILAVLLAALNALHELKLHAEITWLTFANFGVFLAYLVRFFFGNLAYLSNTFGAMPNIGSREGARAGYDLVLLLLHALCFGQMAVDLNDCATFNQWLIALLLSDLWWWAYEERTRPLWFRRLCIVLRVPANIDQAVLPVWVAYVPRAWIANNLVAAGMLLGCHSIAGPEGCVFLNLAVVIISLGNSIVDVTKTRLWIF